MTYEPKPQADKFLDIARELECDGDEAAFEEKVRKVATAPKPELRLLAKILECHL